MSSRTVFIADPQPPFRAGLRGLLEQAGLDVVGEARGGGRQRLSIGGVPVSLTEREAQVLELLTNGMPTQEIARELGLSPVTVRRHVGAIAAKVGTSGRERLLRLVRPA